MADRYSDRPFSADEDDGTDAPPKRPASDPLAELARLIGQADPFSKYNRAGQPPAPSDQHDTDDAAGYDDEPAQQPSWMRNRPPAQDAAYGDEQSFDPRHHDDRYSDHDQAPRFEPQSFDQDRPRGADNSRYDDVLFGQPDRDTRHDAPFPAQNDRYSDDGFNRPRFDEDHDDEMPAPRRGGTMTVVVVLLLAVVGTAAAFGYRTFIGSPRSGEPPVIKADAGPNKVMSSSGDKQITDRIGDKSAERVVSREEQPVDLNGKAQPRVVFPPLSQNTNPPNASSANTAVRPTGAGVGNGTVSTGGEEPRKIRTLTIRPDQPDATATAAPSAPITSPSVAPARPAPAAPRAPASVAPAPAASGGPIALTPQASAPAPAPRVASVTPSTSTPAGGAGSYVQVSSQKTEADAQASFRAIQSKYSGILGSKPSTIRRADLGDKGVFYRAMVGPFGTTDEATQFCVNLKSAGGQCIVQRN